MGLGLTGGGCFPGGSSKMEAPCEHYMGNVCGGFGAPCICYWCGWDRIEHDSEFTDFMVKMMEFDAVEDS